MKRKGWSVGKWGKNTLALTLLALSLGLGAPESRGAESTWSGGNSIVVGAGDTVKVDRVRDLQQKERPWHNG